MEGIRENVAKLRSVYCISHKYKPIIQARGSLLSPIEHIIRIECMDILADLLGRYL